jgi:hypothetical protein
LAEQKHRDESFKVIDRRPFTAEGELRKEAVEEERREQESAKVASEKLAATAEAPGVTLDISGGKPAASAAAAPGPVLVPEGPASSRQFQMLIDFLARNAAAMLGGITDPRTGQAFLDLEGAREMIDLLDVLREKTKGNLAAEDDALLVEVIGSLKLSFMEVSNAAVAAAAAEPKGRAGKP